MEGHSGQKCNLIATCIPLDRIRVPLDRTFLPFDRTSIPFDCTFIPLDHTFLPCDRTSIRSSVRVIKHVLCDPNILNTMVSSFSGWKAIRIHCLCKLCQDCVSSIVSMTGKVHDFPGVSINATMNYEFPPARKSFHNFSHN